jgi:hypothetical protein
MFWVGWSSLTRPRLCLPRFGVVARPILINYGHNDQKKSHESRKVTVTANITRFAGDNQNEPVHGQQEKGERKEEKKSIADSTPKT